jgi:hypothetical protein
MGTFRVADLGQPHDVLRAVAEPAWIVDRAQLNEHNVNEEEVGDRLAFVSPADADVMKAGGEGGGTPKRLPSERDKNHWVTLQPSSGAGA